VERLPPARRAASRFPYTSLAISRNRKYGLLAGLLLALLCLLPAAAPAAVKKHQKPHPVYWGAWIGDQLTGTGAPWDMGAVSRFEELVGKGMSLVEFSSPFEECGGSSCHFFQFPAPQMELLRQHGSIPFFSWGSEVVPRESAQQPDYQLSDLIEGRYDSYIREFAGQAAAWGHPFFLRFDWEMNGNWLPWSESTNGNAPGQYIAAWRHVHDIFESVGASNATWVWCPYADEKHRFQSMRSLYPGGAYVDWTCMDGYNWGQNTVNPQKWRTFPELFETTYKKLTTKIAKRKPVMIAEFGSTANGGHKARWIRNMFAELPRKYPRARGLIWFDTVDRGVDWTLESSSTATAAFSTGIKKGIYANNRFAEIPPGKILPLPSP
jgi:mannan endo-1,4-beta-mannosidase